MPATRFHTYECREESCPRSRRFVCEFSMTVPVAVGKARKATWRWSQPSYYYGPTERIARKRADVAFAALQESRAKSAAGEAARALGRKRQNLERLVRAETAVHEESENADD